MPTTMATPDQQLDLDDLAEHHGYLDRHHAASDVLRRPERQLRTRGLSRADAARVIAELDQDEDDGDEDDAGGMTRGRALAGGAVGVTTICVVSGVLMSVLTVLLVTLLAVVAVGAAVLVARGGGDRGQVETRELPCRASIWATTTRIRSAREVEE